MGVEDSFLGRDPAGGFAEAGASGVGVDLAVVAVVAVPAKAVRGQAGLDQGDWP